MKHEAEKKRICIAAYCLLPNHFHLLAKADTRCPQDTECRLSDFIHVLQMSYSKYYNIRYDHSGAVWQGAYKNKMVETDESFVRLMHYIHLNPRGHGMVERATEWEYSSLLEFLELRRRGIIKKECFPFGQDYGNLFCMEN